MSQAITAVQVIIPAQDINGNGIDYTSFANSIAALCANLDYFQYEIGHYSQTSTLIGLANVLLFQVLTTNNASALALYTTFQAGLASGTKTIVSYSNQTLGV